MKVTLKERRSRAPLNQNRMRHPENVYLSLVIRIYAEKYWFADDDRLGQMIHNRWFGLSPFIFKSVQQTHRTPACRKFQQRHTLSMCAQQRYFCFCFHFSSQLWAPSSWLRKVGVLGRVLESFQTLWLALGSVVRLYVTAMRTVFRLNTLK